MALLLALLALPGFVAGLGLLARRSWAQGLALGVAVAALFWAPVGTACGLASLWVLLQEEVRALFAPPRGRATRVRGLPPPERGGADSGLAAL